MVINMKMILVFDDKNLEKMNRGEVGVWCAHSAMHLYGAMVSAFSSGILSGKSKFGKFSLQNLDWDKFIGWLMTDYKKIVLSCDADLESLYDEVCEADDLQLPCYLQYSAHDGKPKCLAVFGEDEKLDSWTKAMKLVK